MTSDAARALPKRRGPMLLVLLLVLGALLAGALAARRWYAPRALPPVTMVATLYPAARPLPPFELTAQDGSRFDASRLRGRWTLLFFGFTSCPDACPTTLLELAAVRRALADLPPAAAPQVVMISVDPERDTPARLAAFLAHFDPAFVGATGSTAAIAALAAGVGVAVQAGAATDGGYTVEHGATVFLVDPRVATVALFPLPHVARAIAADYRLIVAAERPAAAGRG